LCPGWQQRTQGIHPLLFPDAFVPRHNKDWLQGACLQSTCLLILCTVVTFAYPVDSKTRWIHHLWLEVQGK
jgi:hypothetical protein